MTWFCPIVVRFLALALHLPRPVDEGEAEEEQEEEEEKRKAGEMEEAMEEVKEDEGWP